MDDYLGCNCIPCQAKAAEAECPCEPCLATRAKLTEIHATNVRTLETLLAQRKAIEETVSRAVASNIFPRGRRDD